MKEASFDFGKKPPVDGYTKVTEKSVYTKEKGFGLSEVAEADERKIGEKELNRDFLFMGGKSFIVDIENGEYIVRVSTGDYVDEGDVMTFYNVNGEKYGVWVSDGTVVERVFPVTVTDGKMKWVSILALTALILHKSKTLMLRMLKVPLSQNVIRLRLN